MSDDMLELTPTELHAAYMAGVSLDAYVKARRVVQSPLAAVNMLAQGISSSEIEDYSYRMGCSNLTDRVLDALKSDLDTLSYLRFNHFSRPELSHEQIVDLMKRGVTTEFANSVSRLLAINVSIDEIVDFAQIAEREIDGSVRNRCALYAYVRDEAFRVNAEVSHKQAVELAMRVRDGYDSRPYEAIRSYFTWWDRTELSHERLIAGEDFR